MYTRICPKCGKDIILIAKAAKYKSYRLSMKDRPCRSCSATEINNRPKIKKLRVRHFKKYAKNNPNGFYGKHHNEETIEKLKKVDKSYTKKKSFKKSISKAVSGKNNPMYGKTFYQQWVKKYGEEIANEKLLKLKEKQSKNSKGENNPMYGKKAPHGSGNGWSGWYKKWYFRSILELSYMINVIEKRNKKWISAERKELTIPYISWDGSKRTYRADFLINDKYLIECKPKKLFNTPSNKLKKEAAEKFCQEKGLIYAIEDAHRLSTSELISLHNKGEIRFSGIYKKKFKERYCRK